MPHVATPSQIRLPVLLSQMVLIHFKFHIHHTHQVGVKDDPIQQVGNHHVSILQESLHRTPARKSLPYNLAVKRELTMPDPCMVEGTQAVSFMWRPSVYPKPLMRLIISP